jgi:hypothetical protein
MTLLTMMLTTSDKKNLIQNIDTVYSIIMPFYYLEKFEDTKGIIRIRKLKTERQHNAPKKKDRDILRVSLQYV